MADVEPAITVVVPTYNRALSLARLLEALADCVPPRGGFEVVVVDDGSSDGTADVVRRTRVDARYVRQANRGPAAARNTGWRLARSPIVAFTDDDTVPDRGWLVDLVAAFSADQRLDAAGGMVRPLQLSFLTRFVQAEEHASHGVGPNGEIKYLVTANCAYRRDVLTALDGFDESFPAASGEDTDLTLRTQAGGYRMRLIEGAVVFHDHPNRLGLILKTYLKHGRTRRLVIERNPSTAHRQRDVLTLGHWRRRYKSYRTGGFGRVASTGALGLRTAGLFAYAIGMARSRARSARSGDKPIKVLIACPGADHVARGYERISRELATLLRRDPQLAVSLVKGSGGRSAEETVLPSLRRDRTVARWISRKLSPAGVNGPARRRQGSKWASLPIRLARRRLSVTPYEIEAATFGISVLCHIALRRPDVVVVQDVPTARVVRAGRAVLSGWRTKILFINGTPWPAPYSFADVVQHVTPATWDDDPAEKWEKVLLPLGTEVPEAASPARAVANRRRFGIPEHEKVVVSLGTMLDRHKRHTHLIRELGRLPEPRPFLVIAGAPDVDQDLIEATATEVLGSRQKIIQVSPHEIPALLSCADAFVLASLREGFGLAYLEALGAGLPTITHDDQLQRWLLGPFGDYVDMTMPGHLAEGLRTVLSRDDRWSLGENRRRYVEGRFSWTALGDDYLALIRRTNGGHR